MSEIGRRLRSLREAQGLSQETLAARIGRNQRWLGQREQGVVRTSVEQAEEIARALGYQAELIVAPAGALNRLLDAAATASPADIAAAADLLEALPAASEVVRRMVLDMLKIAHQSSAATS